MAAMVTNNSSETTRLLKRVAAGNRELWGELLTRHQERLRYIVTLRLDRRLQGRIDPSDVVQEALLDASIQLKDYLKDPNLPFFLWLRCITVQKLVALHRHHIGTQARDPSREMPLYQVALPEASSSALAAKLLGHGTWPSEAARRTERCLRLQEALSNLDIMDREMLALRHFEQLSNAEAAEVLGLRPSAASKRYLRALQRLKDILRSMPGGLEGLLP
jgi:RNA polymerase sigma-70 factor (ECF subfamily)